VTPVAPVEPVAPVAPVEPVAPVTPVVADQAVVVTPVVAEPVADPAAAQVLFLGEEALVASAAGSLSGSLLLCLVLIAITLAGTAFMHSRNELRKPAYAGGLFASSSEKKKENEAEMLGEYLLIKN
jgi:hypothetical protein